MALIVCKNCGKKISDSVDKCIHCGFLRSEITEEIKNEIPKGNAIEKEKPQKDFFYYNKEEKAVLEKQFINSDKWAWKYRRKQDSFKKITVLTVGWVNLAFGVHFVIALASPSLFTFTTETAWTAAVSVLLIGILWIASMIILVINSVLSKIHKGSINSIIYHKKFQKWLYENHEISYKPIFGKKKHQEQFESLNLDDYIY